MTDFYETLGVSKEATQKQIKDKYRELAKKHHPDKTKTEDGVFAEISEAYETLSDPVKRDKYDRHGKVNGVDNFIAEIISKIRPIMEQYSVKGYFKSDPIKDIMKAIDLNAKDLDKELEKLESRISLLEKIIGSFECDEEKATNYFDLSIEAQINEYKSYINSVNEAKDKLDKFKQELSGFKYTGEVKQNRRRVETLSDLLSEEI